MSADMPLTEVLHIRMSPELRTLLGAASRAEGIDMSEFARQAILLRAALIVGAQTGEEPRHVRALDEVAARMAEALASEDDETPGA